MPKLWDFFDGEPFMENPHIAVFGNPRKGRQAKTKKGTKMAFKRSRTVNRKRHTRRRARRNFPTAGLVFNPRRRSKSKAKRFAVSMNRRRSYSRNPKRRHHRRRNPAVLGVALPPITMIAWGAGGFIAPPMVEGFVNKFLPTSVTGSTIGRYAVKIGSVLALTYLVKTVMGNKEAFPVALGGSLYVVVSAVNEFAPQLTAGTGAYRGGMINAYRNGMIATGVPTGMGAYNKGVSGSIPGLAHSIPGLAYGPSALLPQANINYSGMTNPTFADPRFTGTLSR